MRNSIVLAVVFALSACTKDAAEPKPKDQGCPDTCVDTPCTGVDADAWRSGTATCNTDTCELDTSACVPACDVTGYAPDDGIAMSDVALFEYQALFTTQGDDTELHLENWFNYEAAVDPGSSATRDLSGVNSNYDDCGTCLLGFIGEVGYFASEGSAQVTAPSAAGENFTMTLTNVKLVGDDDSVWCIPSATFTAPATRFLCDLFSSADAAAAQTYCDADGAQLLTCGDDAGTLVITATSACANGCDDTTADAAVCIE